jgi:hypothetical protein
MTRTSGGTTTRRRYCRSCVEELGLDNPQDSIVLFPWEAQGPNSFSFAGVIARVQPDTVTLRTERSTHYRPGTLLNIKAALVPPGLRRPGAKFSFNFPIEAVPAVLAGDGPVPDVGEPPAEQNPSDLLGTPTGRSAPATPEWQCQEYLTDGVARVVDYASRLNAKSDAACVVISTLDRQHALLLIRDAGRTFLSISADRTLHDGAERRLMDFFGRLGMAALRDRLSSNGGVPDATRTWHFPVGGSPGEIANLCAAIFAELFGIPPAQGLRFSTKGL